MFENDVSIDVKGNKYTFDFLTCFEKPMGLLLSAFGKHYERLFYLYLKFFQSYNTKTFGRQELYIFDFGTMIRWIVEKQLNLKMNIKCPEPLDIHKFVGEQLDEGRPVILTVNLKELFYSRHYRSEDWSSILLINGYDHSKGLYSVLDTTITEYDERVREGQDYKPFVLSYDIVENLYNAYKKIYGNLAFVAYVEEGHKKQLDVKAYLDCIELFLNDNNEQPYRELDYIDEISAYIDYGMPVKPHGVDEFTSKIDFVFTRSLNYKEFFYRELQSAFTMFGVDKAIVFRLEVEYQKLLKLWSKIKTKSVICYNLKAALDVSKQLEEVIIQEIAVRETVREIRETLNKPEDLQRFLMLDEPVADIADAGEDVPQIVLAKEKESIFVEPGDELERRLVQLWADILGRERIGVRDNFFDAGGHSLSMVRLIALMIKEFNVEIPLELFFQAPFIEDIAKYIDNNANSGGYVPIPKIPESSKYPLSAAQKRLFVMDLLNPDSVTYNVTIAMEMDIVLDISRVQYAFNQLVKRHEILRVCFGMDNGVPFQEIKKNVELFLKYKEATVEGVKAVIEDFVRPFELTEAPLIRLMFVKLPENKSILVFDVPHIVIDGVSVGILIREFAELYKGDVQLSDLRVGYMDYVAWQEQIKSSPEICRQEEYWVKRFEGDIPVLNLPLDYPRPKIQDFNGDTVRFTIDRALTDRVYQMSREKEATLYMVLFSAFNVILHKYTGQEDVIIGSPVADRPHADLQNMVGMFVNMMPIRNAPKTDKPFSKFLEEVKLNALDAYRNQDCQFNVLVERLRVKGRTESNPLFNVVFALQNIDLNKVEMDGVSVFPYEYKNKVSKFDILFEVLEDEDGINVIIEYSTALFKKSTIERFGRHYVNILESIVEKPDAPIYELDVIKDDEMTLSQNVRH